ncbi:MAG: uroporphyrinogen decarboxylase family protein [Nitrososphaerota archaeon]
MRMGHVDRVLAVLNYKEPDRVVLDLGSPINGIHHVALKKLLALLGLEGYPVTVYDRMQGLGDIPEFILKHFDIDFRHVRLNPPRLDEIKYLSEDRYVNEFGITFERHGHYFEMVEESKPLYDAKSVKDLEKYNPPRPHEGRVKGLSKIARHYAEEGYAVVADAFTGGIWELAEWLHGLSNSLRDLVINPELMNAILDLTLNIHKEFWGVFLNEVGDYIHIVLYGDDYGLQTGPQMNPRLWERFILPRLRELVSFVKKHTKAKFMLHSCGGIRPLIGKIIEAGIDILNPLQPKAKGMDRRELKKEFGGKVVFHGGIDIQYVMPRGTSEEVRNEVIDAIETYAPAYIFSPAHNIQADVPPQNIVTAYRTALIHNPFIQ